MKINGILTVVLIGATVAQAALGTACGAKPAASAQSSASAPATAAKTGATREVQIVDTTLQMKAYSWTIPSDWIFEGTVMQGSSCGAQPFPVFRMMSPDGITEMKLLPRFDWAWSAGSKFAAPPTPDCLPLNQEMSAAEFLKYMTGVLGVTFVRAEPVDRAKLAEAQEAVKKQNEKAAANAPKGALPFSQTIDEARAVVRYNINSIPVEEYLGVETLCLDNPQRLGQNVAHFYSCSAWLSRARARQGQLEAMRGAFDTIEKSEVIDQQWNQKWVTVALDRMNAASRQATQAISQMAERAQQVQQNSFDQGQAMRQRQHEQFLSTMQRGTDQSMNATQNSMDARSRTAGDWADYALDQQKRLDPATGKISKDSSLYSYTWVDAFGQHYQSNDMNDNPNGRLKGNWTLQQNVR